MNKCITCTSRDETGHCNSEKLQEDHCQPEKKRADMLIYSEDEDGSFWVGENFGCVHHSANSERGA
jgi:hypothetical protein